MYYNTSCSLFAASRPFTVSTFKKPSFLSGQIVLPIIYTPAKSIFSGVYWNQPVSPFVQNGLNFQSTVNLLRRVFFFFFCGGGGGEICPHRTAWIKKSDACNVQSDLDLQCTQKVIMLCLAVQGLIHPKMNDVLSYLWWYYECKKVIILARKKKNKVSVYVFL